MNRIIAFLSKLHWPTYLLATAASSLSYFIATTSVMRALGTPDRPADIISDQSYLPEPLETPFYLASFIIVPLLGIVIYPVVHRLTALFAVRKIRNIATTALVLALVGGLVGAYFKILPFSAVATYLQSHSIVEIVRFMFSKRILIASLILGASALVWIASYLAKIRVPFSRVFNEQTERVIKKILPVAAVILMFLLYHPSLPYDQHHHNYMMGAVNDMVHGKPLLYETFNLYGILNIYFLSALLSLLPFTYQSFTLVLFVTYLVYFASVYWLLRMWLKSRAWALLGSVVSLAVTYFLQISPEQSAYEFHNTGPYRYWLFVPIGFFMLFYSRTKKPWAVSAAIILSSIALFWTFDTGIYLTIATFLTFAITEWNNADTIRERSKQIALLALRYLASIIAVFSVISTVNYLVFGSWPHWIRAVKGILEFRSGIGMQAHPILGVYLLIATAYVLMLVWTARAIFQKRQYDTVALFLLLYGIFAFNYYIGFSVWQLLYYSAPPLLLLIVFFLRQASSEAPDGQVSRLTNATFASLIFYTAAILIVKIPIEFSHRDYTSAFASLTEVPRSGDTAYRDEAMYQDAQTIRGLYPDVSRFPVIHRRSARLLYFLETANFFDFYELQTVTYQREIDRMAEQLDTDRPPVLIIGNEKNSIVEAFERSMPACYKKSLSLMTLDIYTLQTTL